MALDANALSDYTQGRLESDDATTRILARALAGARRYCGWHVNPVLTQTVTLDGPGGLLLQLPTLCVTALTSITEDGVAVATSGLEWSKAGLVRKKDSTAWTTKYGAIAVTMTHGFDDTAAADFEAAVLSYADRISEDGGEPTQVGPFRFSEDKSGWPASAVGGFNNMERSILEQYRLERAA